MWEPSAEILGLRLSWDVVAAGSSPCLVSGIFFSPQHGRSILFNYLRHASHGYCASTEMVEQLMELGVSAKDNAKVRMQP